MNLNITASTSGADDAEVIASTLELLADKVRSAGGSPVDVRGSIEVDNGTGSQTVYLTATAGS